MAELGRPKITPADFPHDWKQKVEQLMSTGASRMEVYNYLDIDDETFARLVKEDIDFSATIKRGLRASQAWWESQGRFNLENKDFNYVGWYMNMKNRFGWRDKQDITTDGKTLPVPIYGGFKKEE